jgi:ABC-type multidrug transport system ATPase subunit
MIPEVQMAEEFPIEASDIAVIKGGHLILGNVSFRLESGSFVALVGPSGSGKTSLLRVLSLLDTPAGGTLRFWGHEPRPIGSAFRVGGHRFYPAVSYVPQTLALWPHMTLLENILFAANGSTQLCEKLEYLCDCLEITEIIGRKPLFVSQGQRQRCALARALLLQPKLLFLDEITAALDEHLARKVWQLLREFTAAGMTIFASTHSGRLASACDYHFQIRECMVKTQFHEQYK